MAARRMPTVEQVQKAFDTSSDKLSLYLSGMFDYANAANDVAQKAAEEVEDLKATVSMQGQRINELLEHTDCDGDPVPTNTGSAKKARKPPTAAAKKAAAKKKAAKKKAAEEGATEPDPTDDDDQTTLAGIKGDAPSQGKLFKKVEKFLAKKNKKKVTRVEIVQEALKVFGAADVSSVEADEAGDFLDKIKALYDEAS